MSVHLRWFDKTAIPNNWFDETVTNERWFDRLLEPDPGAAGTITVSISESQASQTEAITITEKYSATLAESQAAQVEAIIVAEKYAAALSESQANQTESMGIAETYSAALSETQSAQDEAITGTVAAAGAINVDIAEGQAQQTESATAFLTIPTPALPPRQFFVGFGGPWYTYGDLLREQKKRLQEEERRKTEKAPIPAAAKIDVEENRKTLATLQKLLEPRIYSRQEPQTVKKANLSAVQALARTKERQARRHAKNEKEIKELMLSEVA